ncbi:hypothetical protein [Anaerorhabdus sp.]|uniref:hypothetical protein n=1 Tax=Anaerorhabdus sp. TaxID=1872524 RepID=UPI002FC5E443
MTIPKIQFNLVKEIAEKISKENTLNQPTDLLDGCYDEKDYEYEELMKHIGKK